MNTTSPEIVLARLMKTRPIKFRTARMNVNDLLKICAAIEEFNQMMGLPSLLWEDAVRIANFTDRGRQ